MANLGTTSVSMLLLVVVLSLSFASSEAHEDLQLKRQTPRRFGNHVVGHSHGGSAYLVRGKFGSLVKVAPGGHVPIHDHDAHVGIERRTPAGPDPIHHDHVGIERRTPAGPDPVHHDHVGIERKTPAGPDPVHHDHVGIERLVPTGPNPFQHD